jgi:hypothetical protein
MMEGTPLIVARSRGELKTSDEKGREMCEGAERKKPEKPKRRKTKGCLRISRTPPVHCSPNAQAREPWVHGFHPEIAREKPKGVFARKTKGSLRISRPPPFAVGRTRKRRGPGYTASIQRKTEGCLRISRLWTPRRPLHWTSCRMAWTRGPGTNGMRARNPMETGGALSWERKATLPAIENLVADEILNPRGDDPRGRWGGEGPGER